MEKMEVKSLSKPDEVKTFDKGRLEIVKMGGAVIGRATFPPGWKGSDSESPSLKPTAAKHLISSTTSLEL